MLFAPRIGGIVIGWSLRISELWGITIRLHVLFLLYVLVEIFQALWQGGPRLLGFAAGALGVLLLSVFLHELGHCWMARRQGGTADEILLWPLGGLAHVDAPREPAVQAKVAVAGPGVNFLLALGCAAALGPEQAFRGLQQIFLGWPGEGLLAQLYHANLVLLAFNLLPGFPMDGGRILQCVLWSRTGYERATEIAIQVGKVVAVAMGIFGIVQAQMLLVVLAFFVFYLGEREKLVLEGELVDEAYGAAEPSYLAAAESEPPVRMRKRRSLWQRLTRWRQRRKLARNRRREAEIHESVDRLLDQIRRKGLNSLSQEERSFLEKASDHYRSLRE